MRNESSTIPRTVRHASLVLALLALGSPPLVAQGLDEYCNFESPQVKPILVATVPTVPAGQNRQYVLACNTPDNTIEVFDVSGALRDNPTPVARIPVGLEPVSLAYKRLTVSGQTPASRNMLYAVNWLGDSVTFVELSVNKLTLEFKYKVTKEVRVTDPLASQDGTATGPDRQCDDEPMHLAIVDRPGESGQYLVVAKRGASSYSLLHPYTGAFVQVPGTTPPNGGKNAIMTRGTVGQVVFGETLGAGITMALKQPHAVVWRPNSDQFFVLGHKGGGSTQTDAFGYDFDLWGIRLATSGNPQNSYYGFGGLATINFNLAFDSAGAFLYVVGTEAQDQLQGNGNLLKDPATRTGLARTMLYRIDAANMSSPTIVERDVNLRYGPLGQEIVVNGPAESLSHVTDVAIYEEPGTGKVFACLAGFNSSRFGMAFVGTIASPAAPNSWTINTLTVGDGPRGVAVFSTGTAANDRAYLLNRFDPSITIVRLNGGTPALEGQFALQRPAVEPAYIRDGRKFLYGTEFSGPGQSGHGLAGFVACASCHIDARSDHVSWRLTARAVGSEPTLSSVMSPPPDNAADALETAFPVAMTFPSDVVPNESTPPADEANAKGIMFTQSLQGLSNFEVGGSRILSGGVTTSTGFFADESDAATADDQTDVDDDAKENPFDDLISNAPYHWRGDKENFRHFNEAFVNLMGMSTASDSVPSGGLTTIQMRAFERFINSIHYPPNPNQQLTRVYSGNHWVDPHSTTSETNEPSDAKRGLQAFHIRTVIAVSPLSCNQCHEAASGSNGRFTEVSGIQPLETTAIRGVVQKDGALRLSPSLDDDVILTGDFGMAHTGTNPEAKSTNSFIDASFPGLSEDDRSAVVAFVREFDSGVGPMVGYSFSLTEDPGAGGDSRVAALETQAGEANCGIAVYARVKASGVWVTRGYWYDVTNGAYKQAGASTLLTRAQLFALLVPLENDDLLVFRGTPLGSDRRVASFALASSDQPIGPIGVPASVKIVGTTPNSANDPIVELSRKWDPLAPTTPVDLRFHWPPPPPFGSPTAPIPLGLSATLAFQTVVGVFADGATHRRHDAPRRLQVTGNELHPGVKLRLTLPNVAGGDQVVDPPFRNVELPLYPTTQFWLGKRIWESDAEFDPLALYTMMLGGPADVAVDATLRRAPPTGTLSVKQVSVQAANLPYTTWSSEPPVDFDYPKRP